MKVNIRTTEDVWREMAGIEEDIKQTEDWRAEADQKLVRLREELERLTPPFAVGDKVYYGARRGESETVTAIGMVGDTWYAKTNRDEGYDTIFEARKYTKAGSEDRVAC